VRFLSHDAVSDRTDGRAWDDPDCHRFDDRLGLSGNVDACGQQCLGSAWRKLAQSGDFGVAAIRSSSSHFFVIALDHLSEQNSLADSISTSRHVRPSCASTYSLMLWSPAPPGPNTIEGMPDSPRMAASVQKLIPPTTG